MNMKSKSVPFKAQFNVNPNYDQVFSVTPSAGELCSSEGVLIKVGFLPHAYGKTYQNYLLITVGIKIYFVFIIIFKFYFKTNLDSR
jgi:hypothetical protein